MNGCLKVLAGFLVALLIVGAGFWVAGDYIKDRLFRPNVETVAQATLQGLREQNRLSTFAARYVAVVTSSQSQLGMTAKKTMIMPGTVRYEVDLSKLRQKDVAWDPGSRTLTVTLPPVEVVGPEVDVNNIREFKEGGLLMSLTNAEASIDAANKKAGQAELVRQAQEATPMKLARDATRRAVERNFAMPLRAVGEQANVLVYFADENHGGREQWDVSTRPEDVIANMK